MTYIQIDPCTPAVVPSPGSAGGICLDVKETNTQTTTSTVSQTVNARYVNADSIQANQVSTTNLIVDGTNATAALYHMEGDSTSVTINSDLEVTGGLLLSGVLTLPQLTINGPSYFEGDLYTKLPIYGNVPLYPSLSSGPVVVSGTTVSLFSSIPSWAKRLEIHLYKVTRNTTAYQKMQIETTTTTNSCYIIGEEGRVADTASGITYDIIGTNIPVHSDPSGYQGAWPVTGVVTITFTGTAGNLTGYTVRINGMTPNYGNRWEATGYHEITDGNWSYLKLLSGGAAAFNGGVVNAYIYS